MNTNKPDIEGWNIIAEEYSKWLDGDTDIKGMAFTHIVTANVLSVLGDVSGKAVLDLGCGEGYLSRYIQKKGGLVCGIDGAPNMINIAKNKDRDKRIIFTVGDITQPLPYDSSGFDIVLCNMVLMDVEDITMVFQEVARVLTLGGKFVFSVVHPCYFDALGDWSDVDTLNPALRFRNRYIEQVKYPKKLVGLPSEVDLSHYNRPIQQYVNSLIKNSFCISDFIETSFSREFLEELDLYHDLIQYHLTANNLIVGAVKAPSHVT